MKKSFQKVEKVKTKRLKLIDLLTEVHTREIVASKNTNTQVSFDPLSQRSLHGLRNESGMGGVELFPAGQG